MIENKEPLSFDCSVIVPCYNSASTIGACIASIMAQTLKPKEVIAIDDGSRDNTLELLLALQKEYQEEVDIEVIHQKNSGPSKARNEGIRKAKCEWIAFLDSDDAWHPQALEVAKWSCL
ncbi:MAG: glycosyltransferase family 2 protein [Porphyromonas endodontalis]|uniref:glycosyltransferase family 2 protein n=1 Tax=Porphyromonas endodontalis TaxID=28124 RepID=UPI003F9FECF1